MNKNAIRARARKPLPKVCNTEQFRNIHEGKKCFVCGAGTSIGHLDLTGIHEYPVVAVNSSALLMPWDQPGEITSRFWVSTDLLCMQWDYFWNKVAKFECVRLVRNSWSRNTGDLKNLPMHYYSPRRSTQTPDWNGDGLMAGSSILSATDLALLMGCKQVILLGVDHRMVNGHSHFWQNWPVKDRPKREGKPGNFMPCQRQQSRVFKSNYRSFEVIRKYSEALGAKIYNCSTVSTIETFDKISLDDALAL
jgi:hypothetical protein